jgi:predicted nucleic acid-binding protein
MTPALWRLELANGLRMAVRRKRIDAAFRDRALAHLGELPIAVDPETDAHAWTTALRVADRFDLTLHDAAYLELALRRSAPLATLGEALRSAAASLEVPLLGIKV